MKRTVAVLLAAVAIAGCGASTFTSGISKAEHHVRTGRHSISAVSLGLCGYHAWRTYADAHHGSMVFTGFQAWRTAHNCRRVRR